MNSRILPTLVLIGAAVIFFFYIGPTWNGTIMKTKASIAADEEALVAAKQYSNQQNQLAAARDAIDPTNMALLSAFLPSSVDNVSLILDIDALAARSQFSLLNINVTKNAGPDVSGGGATSGTLPAPGTGALGSVDLSLTGVGTFASLQDFLSGIEKSVRLLDVHDLEVRGSETGVYNYKMSIRLYWLR
jgi:Tfp pilus assembly protein PilO